MDFIDWVLLLSPITTGYATSAICGMGKDAGKNIKARPPGWVFGVVWPVLYLLLGYSWVLMRHHGTLINVLFILNVVGLVSWVALYSCGKQKKNAMYILLVLVVLALMTLGNVVQSDVKEPVYYLSPYIGWLVFALLLNFTEVNNLK